MISPDITESKQVGITPHEIAALSQQLTEHIREVFWLVSPDWQEVLYVSPAYAEIWGRSCESLYARPLDWLDFVVDADREQVIAAISIKRAGDLAEVTFPDYRIRRPDGSERWIHARAFPVCDADGNVYRIAGIAEDITYRKRTEELLRESNDRFKTMVEQAPLGITLIDSLTGQFLEINPRYAEIVGRTIDKMSIDWMNITHPDDVQSNLDNMALVNAGKINGFQIEKRYLHPDGKVVWANLTVAKLRVEDNTPPRHLAMVEDITERKQVEAALQESEARLARFFEASYEGIFLHENGKILDVNPATTAVFGYDPVETIGRNLLEFVAPESREMVKANMAAGHEGPYEVAIVANDGSTIHVEVRAKTIEFHGLPVRVVGMRDITERKRVEEALRANEERLQLATTVGNIGVWDWNVARNEVTWDESMYTLYGVRKENFGGAYDAWSRTLHPDDRQFAEAEIQAALRGEREYAPEFRIVRQDGTVRNIKAVSKTFRDQHGNPLRMIGTNIDITERKQAEQALLEADQRKDEFLAMLAHELRNPLAPIRNAAYVLAQPGLDESRLKWAQETIEGQVTHLTRLVDDLLDVSRIARGKITLKQEGIELTTLVEKLMQSIRPLAENKRHQLTVRLPEHPVQMSGDPVRLNQILLNLIDNAIKYTPDGGQIELDARMAGHEIEISVRDNGMGISAELLPRVFDLFQQDERKLDRAQGGLGIGLTLVQRLVGMHGGRITADSEGPGLGATFTIWLPAKLMPARPAMPEAVDNISHASGMRVLVVDDDVAVADSMAVLLEVTGNAVRIADTGQTALEQIPLFRPQVVLLDIGLSGMDGFETAKRLRELPEGRDLCVMALTGYADEKTREKALASGCDHFLVKPVKIAVLGSLLAKVAETAPNP